jgi:hypothetical protein
MKNVLILFFVLITGCTMRANISIESAAVDGGFADAGAGASGTDSGEGEGDGPSAGSNVSKEDLIFMMQNSWSF